MPWTKTRNLYSVDPADPLAEQNLSNAGMVGHLWGSGVPVSSKELEVMDRITLDTLRRMIRRNGQSGFVTRPSFITSAGYPANTFHMPKAEAYVDGLAQTVVGSLFNSDTEGAITLTAPPVGGTRFDLVFLECWLTEIVGSTASVPVVTNKPDATHVYKWGNVQYGGTNPADDINEVNFEVCRRVQLQYRIRTFPGADFGTYPSGVNDPVNTAQGPNGSATALPFAQSSADSALFVAGSGTVAHQGVLGTLDGFVYAIPIAKVLRTSGVTIVGASDLTDLRLLWGGSSGTLATLSGDNIFTGRQQFAKGADLAPGSSVITTGSDGNLFVVNGNGPWTGIAPLPAGSEVDLLFPNPVNLIHNDTSFILPYKRIYRTVPNEIMTFKSNGAGFVIKGRSGPSDCVGTSKLHNGSTAPDGYVLEYKQSLLATSFEGLLTEYLGSFVSATVGVPGAPAWSTFAANASTDEITVTGHGKVAGDVVFFANTGGAMPGNLVAYTKYFVALVTGANTFKVSATRGGAVIDITSTGSGTLNAFDHFYAGDMNGRVGIAADNLGGVAAGRVVTATGSQLGAGGGEEKHTQLVSEMPSHVHGDAFGGTLGGGGGGNNPGAGTAATTNPTGGGNPFNVMQPYQTKSAIVRV